MAIIRMSPALSGGLILLSTATPVAASGVCTSGWTGQVNYSRAFATSTSNSGKSISSDGNVTNSSSITSDYSAQVAVRAGAEPGSSVGRANINYSSRAKDGQSKTVVSRCPGERATRTMSGETYTESIVKAAGSAVEAEVDVSVDDDGTYSVSVGLPEITGTVSGSNKSSFSGQCSAMPARDSDPSESPTTVDGYRFGSDGTTRVAASVPNQLSGSYSTTNFGLTETLTWNLRRCAGTLYLVDLKFADMKFPTWNAWQDIVEQRGTIDGNRVRITAIVANDGPSDEAVSVKFKETYKGDKWDGAKPDAALNELSVDIPAGQQREVQFEWDSSGYAWYDDGRPRLVQRIRAELVNKGKPIGEKVANLRIAPKPIVLVHGLWSNWRAFETWQNILTTSHSYNWKAFPVGENPEHGLMSIGNEFGTLARTKSPLENSREIESYVAYAQTERNAWQIDMVAHSLGGLASRRYIAERMPTYPDKKPQIVHLLMLGTPNLGSNCAEILSIYAEMAGMVRPTGSVFHDISDMQIEGFNRIITDRNGVKFSALAGKKLPITCGTAGWNDGLVTVNSAIGSIEDHMEMPLLHNEMLGTVPFSSFVKPRLAIGPGKQEAPAAEPAFRAKSESNSFTPAGSSVTAHGVGSEGLRRGVRSDSR